MLKQARCWYIPAHSVTAVRWIPIAIPTSSLLTPSYPITEPDLRDNNKQSPQEVVSINNCNNELVAPSCSTQGYGRVVHPLVEPSRNGSYGSK